MKIHTELKEDVKDEKIFNVEVSVPKTDKPIVSGEDANKSISEALNFFENQIMEHKWTEELGYDEKIEILRQYALYWFLKNIVQVEYYPLPKEN